MPVPSQPRPADPNTVAPSTAASAPPAAPPEPQPGVPAAGPWAVDQTVRQPVGELLQGADAVDPGEDVKFQGVV
jgi:hypothetical protein